MTSATTFSQRPALLALPRRSQVYRAGIFVFGVLPALAAAQNAVPDAGSLRQQIEQQRQMPVPPPERPVRVAPPPEAKPQDGMSVNVKSFKFAGNNLLSAEQLEPLLTEFLNRSLGFDGLQRAADAVAAAYREAGWIARVYLPEQDISEGLITLQVVESLYGGLRFEQGLSQRVKPGHIQSYFESRQAVGAPLAANQLDRALLLVDDLPGISVAGTLAPGEADGETMLVLQTTDEPLIYGDVAVDNTGSRSTGSGRLSLSLNINSPTGNGELIAVSMMKTQGSDYGRVGVTFPVGSDGLRLGVNVSDMSYKVVAGDSANANVMGTSSSLGADLNFPLVRSRTHNLYMSAGAERKGFRNEANGTLQSQYETFSTRVGLSGNWFDGVGGGGANSASIQAVEGTLFNIEKRPASEVISTEYRKLNYSASRQQTVTNDHSLYAVFSGQYATHLLDSSERIYIGGASGVRAYPSSEQGGDKGYSITGEWRWRLDNVWLLTTFADMGRVRSLAPKVNPGDGDPVTLRGAGLSLSWRGPWNLNNKLTWSHRMGANPKPTASGNDSDGLIRVNRIWFSTAAPF